MFIQAMNTGIHPYLLYTKMAEHQNEYFKSAVGMRYQKLSDTENMNSSPKITSRKSKFEKVSFSEIETPEELVDWFKKWDKLSDEGFESWSKYLIDFEIDGETLEDMDQKEIRDTMEESLGPKDWLKLRRVLK